MTYILGFLDRDIVSLPNRTEYPVMSPLRWIQSTGLHWTVMLEEVASYTLTEVGEADGAGGI